MVRGMIGTMFRCADVPAQDRLAYWREQVGRVAAPLDVTSPYAIDYWAEQRVLELGAVAVWRTTCRPARFLRNARMVRQSDPEFFHLRLCLAIPGGSTTLGVKAIQWPCGNEQNDEQVWVHDGIDQLKNMNKLDISDAP
jgi:hypothetical protein